MRQSSNLPCPSSFSRPVEDRFGAAGADRAGHGAGAGLARPRSRGPTLPRHPRQPLPSEVSVFDLRSMVSNSRGLLGSSSEEDHRRYHTIAVKTKLSGLRTFKCPLINAQCSPLLRLPAPLSAATPTLEGDRQRARLVLDLPKAK